MEAPSKGEGGARPVWRRAAGNFYAQLGAAYSVVAVATYVRAFPFRSEYIGKIWLTPLYAYWDPRVTWRVVPAAVAVALATLLIIRAARARKFWLLPLGAFVNVTAINFGPAFGRTFPRDWFKRFLADARIIFEAPNVFVDYVEITKGVGCHCRTRPGLLYWLLGSLDRLFSGNTCAIAFVFIALAAASVLILYGGARALGGREAGPTAAALFACAPALLIFGSGADALNCAVATAVMALGLKAAAAERPWPWAAAAGVLLAVALTLSYALTVVVVFLAAFALAAALSGRGPLRPWGGWLVIILSATAALTVFQIATGYDHVAVFKRAYWANQELPTAGTNVFKLIARALGYGGLNLPKPGERPYWVFVFGNLYTTCFIIGIPVAVLYAREMFRIIRRKRVRRSLYGAAMVGFLVAFLANNFSGLVLGEVERVWLFIIPWFFIPAAVELVRLRREEGGGATTVAVFVLVAAQSFIYKILVS